MAEPDPSEPEPPAPDEGDAPQDGGLDRLRELLVGQERAELEELRARLDRQHLSAEDVSRVLPEAVTLRTRRDSLLADTLSPTIEGAIERSVKRNPRPLTDAIFPLIGPAIRKSLREALATLVEGMNRSLEHSLSPRGIRWRLEARRTGKPFAEVVLMHSLVFRVEEVFLIHRDSALALEHVVAPTVASKDPDVISSMLGAIQDFVSDSFAEGEDDHVAEVEFGDHHLVVAQGPAALVACSVRGPAPRSLRTQVQEVVELIHAELGTHLAEFDGDDTPFLAARPALEELLLEERAERAKRAGLPWPVLIATAALLLLAAVWLVNVLEERGRWTRAREALAAEVGIVLTDARREDGQYVLDGLRDPLAADPRDVLEAQGLDPERVEDRLVPFPSADPSLVARRAERALSPPSTVTLTFADGHLALGGRADHSWIVRAVRRAAGVPGVVVVNTEGLVDVDLARVVELAARIEARVVPFTVGDAHLDPERAEVRVLREDLHALEEAVADTGITVAVTVVGGFAEAENASLGLERARAVGSLLAPCPSLLHLAPLSSGTDAGPHATVRVRWLGDPAGEGFR